LQVDVNIPRYSNDDDISHLIFFYTDFVGKDFFVNSNRIGGTQRNVKNSFDNFGSHSNNKRNDKRWSNNIHCNYKGDNSFNSIAG
jgi:hypothetical protein